MTEEIKKKGMSKGCLIALIVVGVLVILLVIAGITCYLKKDDLARFGAATLVNGVKTHLSENPPAGIDTTQVNALIDAFLLKINESDLDYEKYGRFMQAIQSIPSDEKVDSAEVALLMQSMIEYFPELQEYLPEETQADTTMVEDSI